MRAASLSLALMLSVSACLPKRATEEDTWTGIVKAMPWMMKMLEHCEVYKNAKKQTDKTEIYHATQRIMKRAMVKKARGEVDKVMANRPVDPEEYSLQISVDDKVFLTSQSAKRPIKRGKKPFKQVAALEDGQCVIFSARALEPLAPFEAGKVCNFRYYAKFTDVKPCP